MSPASQLPLPASVIIPVYNGSNTLDNCLKALAAQTVDSAGFEVIVIDDGSTDGSAEIAARRRVKVIRQQRAGADGDEGEIGFDSLVRHFQGSSCRGPSTRRGGLLS